MSIHGMERILDDGSALNVLAYGTKEDPSEFSWMIRLWDDQDGYSIHASYDEDLYFDTVEEAYDDLVAVLEDEYPYLIARDEIAVEPQQSKSRFLAKLISVGLAAALAMSALTGCADAIAYASPPEYDDIPLGTARIVDPTYESLISSSIELEGYDAFVEIMASGENPDIEQDGVTGWYDGDFESSDLSIHLLNYASYDNPLFSMYKTGADDGIAITLDHSNGNVRITSNATLEGDDFGYMYDQVDRAADHVDSLAAREADGSTAEYVKALATYLAETVDYISPNSSAHCNDIYGALINHESACYGFSSAMKYIMDKRGIPNFIATGYKHGVRHAWNMVDMDGTWLVVDVTSSKAMMHDEGVSYLSDCEDPDIFLLHSFNFLDGIGAGFEPDSETFDLMRL